MTRKIVDKYENGQYIYPAPATLEDGDVVYMEKAQDNGTFVTSRLLGSVVKQTAINAVNPLIPSGTGLAIDPRFQAWPLGAAVETKLQRKIANAGGTIARAGFAADVVAFALPGGGMRIWRTATLSSTAHAYYCVNLTAARTYASRGEPLSVALDMRKGVNFSGTGVKLSVNYSAEPEQAIRNADGTYSSGNQSVYAGSAVMPGSAYAGDATTYGKAVTVPADANQISFVLEIDWAGTAGTYDYVEFDFADMQLSSVPFVPARRLLDDILREAAAQAFSSYPYGAVPGTPTSSPLGAIAVNEELNFSYILNPQWPQMEYVPTVYAYSPLDGQDFEALNKTSGENENSTVFDAGPTGAKITNNAYASAFREYSSHAVAIARM